MKNISQKIFTWTSVKWILLLISLSITAIITLMFYDGVWGLGKWSDGSKIDMHTHQVINDQPGPGQWRLKQLLITFFGGGALAFAGVLLQKITKNNLAEVSILGIGSINIMFIFAYIFIFKGDAFNGSITSSFLPVITIVASLIGTLIIWAVSRSKRANKNTFVIIGIALQLLFEALSVLFINPSKLGGNSESKKTWATIKKYTMGMLDTADTPFWLLIVVGIGIAAIITVAIVLRKKIDIYESSPALATTLGIRVERLRITIFVLVALLAGLEASILGTVALLGLIAPSIARLMFKNKFASLAIASFIIGGILVSTAGIVSINFGTELPVGILATAIATPYFIFLILRGK